MYPPKWVQNIFWNSSREGDGQLCDGEKRGLFFKRQAFWYWGIWLGPPLSYTHALKWGQVGFTDCLNAIFFYNLILKPLGPQQHIAHWLFFAIFHFENYFKVSCFVWSNMPNSTSTHFNFCKGLPFMWSGRLTVVFFSTLRLFNVSVVKVFKAKAVASAS